MADATNSFDPAAVIWLTIAVLVHEMVHAYIDMFFPKRLSRSAHGKAFWTFKELVETMGLPFDVYYNDEDIWKKMGRTVPKYELKSWEDE